MELYDAGSWDYDNMHDYLQELIDSYSNNSSMFDVVEPSSALDIMVDSGKDPANYDYVSYMSDISAFSKSWTEDKLFWPTVITYGLTFFLGIVGNILVVFALVLDRKERNVTSYFLISLAMADICFLLLCVPYETLLELRMTWVEGSVLCKLAGFVEMLSACASVMNLMAVSVERYIVIVHPMKSRFWCTVGNTKKIILAVWLVAFLLSSPTLHIMDKKMSLYYNSNTSYVVVHVCAEYNIQGPNDRLVFAYYQLIIMFIFPILVMVFCYSQVIRVLWSSTKALARMTSTVERNGTSTEEDGSRMRFSLIQNYRDKMASMRAFIPSTMKDRSLEVRTARKQVIRMLLVIICIFFVCWGPKLVLNILKRHEMEFLHFNNAFYVNQVINLLPYIHSCLNPLVYGFMSKNFKRSMRSACKAKKCKPCLKTKKTQRCTSIDTDSKPVVGRSPSCPDKPYIHILLTASTHC